jgi:hypothetical protein
MFTQLQAVMYQGCSVGSGEVVHCDECNATPKQPDAYSEGTLHGVDLCRTCYEVPTKAHSLLYGSCSTIVHRYNWLFAIGGHAESLPLYYLVVSLSLGPPSSQCLTPPYTQSAVRSDFKLPIPGDFSFDGKTVHDELMANGKLHVPHKSMWKVPPQASTAFGDEPNSYRFGFRCLHHNYCRSCEQTYSMEDQLLTESLEKIFGN